MVVLTAWPPQNIKQVVPVAQRVRPGAIMVHADPDTLHDHGHQFADYLRGALDFPCELWAGVALDGHYQATLARLAQGERQDKIRADLLAWRLRAVDGALAMGATTIVLDPETHWAKGTPGFDGPAASELIAAIRAKAPALRILVTSFDESKWFHLFPWREFDACDAWAPQVYAAVQHGAPDPHLPMGRARLAEHVKEWGVLQNNRTVRARPEAVYVQAHGVTVRETCCIADAFDVVAFWAFPGECDESGEQAAHALAEIERQGFNGPGRVARFQASHGLQADGLVGPATLAALFPSAEQPK